jgi:hypothetical protein
MARNWIAVASADHARRGGAGGFMQVSHGKLAPLKRIAPGDRVAYYAPTLALGGKEKCQAFILLGVVRGGEPYQADMGGSFRPFRRDVNWLATNDAPIAPLLDALDFTAGKRNWGYQLRFGLLAVSDHDIALIARAMGIAALP